MLNHRCSQCQRLDIVPCKAFSARRIDEVERACWYYRQAIIANHHINGLHVEGVVNREVWNQRIKTPLDHGFDRVWTSARCSVSRLEAFVQDNPHGIAGRACDRNRRNSPTVGAGLTGVESAGACADGQDRLFRRATLNCLTGRTRLRGVTAEVACCRRPVGKKHREGRPNKFGTRLTACVKIRRRHVVRVQESRTKARDRIGVAVTGEPNRFASVEPPVNVAVKSHQQATISTADVR